MRIHAMIAEDERLAREELAYLLQQEEDIVLCPSAETGEQLLQLLEQYRPDVIFLDIQMPALSGVEAAKKMRQASDASSPVPLIVFTTAFDDYAVEAFELEAVDYLLKPYDEERFKVAIDRVRRWLSHSVTQEETGKVAHAESGAFSRASAAAAATVAKPRTAKVLVNDGKKSIVLAPEEICYAVRVRRTLEIHTSAQVLRCKMTLQELEEKLRGFPFFRVFYLLITFVGYGANVIVGPDKIAESGAGGNMAAPLLALYLGGGPGTIGGEIFMATIAAVSFATIVAVVAGLVIAASGAFAHDIYTNVVKRGKATEKEQFRVARITAIIVGALSIVIGILGKGQNVAYLVALAFAVAASANLPALLLSLYWKRFNTKGALAGMVVGMVAAITLVILGPSVLGENAVFPLANPGIISIPLGFLTSIIVALVTKPDNLDDKFEELDVRTNTGLGAEM